ncbi:two-component system chemotaxis sensor kinase CheA [Oceanotoga teriensis]|uniref:Chemotaxis protein CheA n=1 Tax=Oceanotoga teriensis TaxID=515440 RepID=A0AA45HID1_9BACT|nr:chemotaxis protein CheA [Oceanotoga teriensis]PWJ91282.1 two-component system chemotaxis sensor kinase CheA [Oceanotoga teriensis]
MEEEKKIIESLLDDKNEIIKEEEFDEEMWEDFVVEARDHLENIERGLLDLENDKENEEIINSIFRSFHTIKGLAGFVDIAFLVSIAHETETLLDKARKKDIFIQKELIDLFLISTDIIKNIIENVRNIYDKDFIKKGKNHIELLRNFTQSDFIPKEVKISDKKIGEILEEMGAVSKEEIEKILEEQKSNPEIANKKIGEILIKEKKADTKTVLNALRSQKKELKTNILVDDYIRVPAPKIENLLNLVGELMIIESQVNQDFMILNDIGQNTQINVNRMLKLTKDIQNITMSMQMVPLKSTFQKITRIARDTINTLKKEVDFKISGESTEIDKAVAEKILDPLIHMIKNSISHGIEDSEERIKKGKNSKGIVSLKAYSNRGNVYIEVSDDGKGLNSELIYKKAMDKKLIDEEKEYSEDEILEFIYLPGFSTLEKANNISGRGVGMDVVKTELSRIGGKINIQNERDKGCTFILKIPINLAAMNGTIIEILNEKYIIPTIYIKKILQPTSANWISYKGNKNFIKYRNKIIPIIPTNIIFNSNKSYDNDLIVILELDNNMKALPVKNIEGRQEIVVKPLGKEIGSLDYFSGASILGDGNVSLIIDVESLFKLEGGE